MAGRLRGATFALLVVALSAGFLEAGSRLVLGVRHRFPAEATDLDPYEIADARRPGRWLLRPGYTATLASLRAGKESAGRLLAVERLEAIARERGIAGDEVILRVNSDGFKGPEIDHAHTHPRILALGDSCTFGTWFDRFSYPRVLERELRAGGRNVEVINGGVEGYVPASHLARVGDYAVLAPEMTTIYLGWNALFDEREALSWPQRHFAAARLAAKARRRLAALLTDPREAALVAYRKPKRPRREAPEVRALAAYEPSFRGDLERLVAALRGTGSQVALMTLPGLYIMEEDPAPRALQIGHLPEFTDNPFVLARLTQRYNETLREIARAGGLLIVDLERWSLDAFRPREDFFTDSVHLTEEAQEALGRHLAAELAAAIPPRRAL